MKKNYKVLQDSQKIYDSMISDIRKAKKEILLETYIYRDDKIGRLFKSELIKKARQGIKIRLLIDGWGSNVKKDFFKEIIQLKGKVRFFRSFKYVFHFFDANHERNHRKLIIIDNKISYIGSINIMKESLNWSELVLRFEDSITNEFRNSFNRTWRRFNFWGLKKMKKMIHKSFEIINDIPSSSHNPTEKKYLRLIKNSKKEIKIITPYFVPSIKIRNALKKAIKRGVVVEILMPSRSDARLTDAIRDRYLGQMHKFGVKMFFTEKFIHSKLLIIDEGFFILGSSNLDYRSFRHQFEINVFGIDKNIIKDLKIYFDKNKNKSIIFKYDVWEKRRFFNKFLEYITEPLREYF